MPAYPVRYEADFIERRSRLTTFFRLLLAIPHGIVAYLYGIGAVLAVIPAWLALLFTGRYPRGLYDFLAGYVRFNTRYLAYAYLAADPFPPFDADEHDEYPVRVRVAPPAPSYDRLKVLFRFVLVIPVAVLAYALHIVAQLAALLSWFHIVVTGRQHPSLQAAVNLGVSYNAKTAAYALLLTEDWPPFSDETAAPAPAGSAIRPE